MLLAVGVLAAVIEALMEADLRTAGVGTPTSTTRSSPPPATPCESRRLTLTVAERTIERDTRHSALEDRILAAFGVEAASWAPAAAG